MRGRLLTDHDEIVRHSTYLTLGWTRRAGLVLHDPDNLGAIALANRDPDKAKEISGETDFHPHDDLFNITVAVTLKTEVVKAACVSLIRDLPSFVCEAEAAGIEFGLDLPTLTKRQIQRLTGLGDWSISDALGHLIRSVVPTFEYPKNRKHTIEVIRDFPDSEFACFPVRDLKPCLLTLVADLEKLMRSLE